LRAQISRIVHNTALLPKMCWRIVSEEEPREIEPNENDDGVVPVPTFAEMAQLKNWGHANPNILGNSRTTHLDPEEKDIEGWDAEVEKKKIEEADPYAPRLQSISEDAPISMTGVTKSSQKCPAWTLRVCGDATEYLNEANKKVCFGVIVVRSLQWPGAYTIYTQGRAMHIYIGNGLKFDSAPYKYASPPTMCSDPSEYSSCPEPNPINLPPPEVQPQVDDVEKPAEEGEGENNEEEQPDDE
jgi:hypothetical protein